MGLLAHLFGRHKISKIGFQPDWTIRCEMMNLLEKDGYDLKIRSGKRDLSIVNFFNLEELNQFLDKFNLAAEEMKGIHTLNPKTHEIFINIKISLKNKKLANDFKKALISLYNKRHIAIFYTP